MSFVCPDKNCRKCPRLIAFREGNIVKFPTYYNGPVEPFGSLDAEILVVGLAPGLNGANQTNRPFTNDYAGDVLYPILKKYGFAKGDYQKRKDDGFELINVRITNSVRCVPPQNKVTGDEVKACGSYLIQEIENMPNLKIILTLGSVAHNAVLGFWVIARPGLSLPIMHCTVWRSIICGCLTLIIRRVTILIPVC